MLLGSLILQFTILFAFFYLRRYRFPHETDFISFATSVFALVICLVTSALLPIDIFLVSVMKTPEGEFEDWASNNETRERIEDGVQYTYYTLYSIVFVALFMIIPFVYFFFEEKEDDVFGSPRSRFCSALKYTLAFMLVASILLMVGAFAPLNEIPKNTSDNGTIWDKIPFLWKELASNKGEDALAMVLSILSMLGMVNLVCYTGFGMFSWPMGLIRGTKSARNQSEEIQEQHLVNQTRINALRDKQRIGGRLSGREAKTLAKLERQERQITRQEQLVDEVRDSLWYKCRKFVRPFEITLGSLLGLLAFLLWISLLLTNIDKAINSLGPRMGYALSERTFSKYNPIDQILVFLQRVFPLDYLLLLVITWFLVLCTVSGIRNLGVRIFFIRMYRLKLKRTRPQALLMTCVTLMLTVLAINIFLFCVSPQYVTFGSQHYVLESTDVNGTQHNQTMSCQLSWIINEKDHETVKPANATFPVDDCVMTRNSAFLMRFFYKAWFFGAAYYWFSWAFLVVSFLSFVIVIVRKSRAITDDLEDDGDSDLEELDSDDPGRTRNNGIR